MNHDGIGLGLAITKSVVEKSGGSIELQSDGIGKGTKVTFSMCVDEVATNGESALHDSVNGSNSPGEDGQDGFFLFNMP